MLSDSLHQFLTLTSECRSRNRDSSDQATFFQSSIWSGYITSGYLSYCCLSIISNQSTHSPLTSDINKAFSYTQLPLTGYFLFFGPFSGNPRDGYENPSRSAVFEILRPACLAPITIPG